MIGEQLTGREVLQAMLLGTAEWESKRDANGWPSDDHWWLHRRVLPDGRVLTLAPMLHGNLRLGISPDERAQWFDDHWCYHDRMAAWRNVLAWDGTGEPDGWYRHHLTARRRPDGTPESEYIQP